MDKDKIKPFDIYRMIFGDSPPGYYIEVVGKALVLYMFMLFIMRWLGKRMVGELTLTERVLMVTLGSSVAVAMQVPESGVLLGFVVLVCALLFEHGVSILTMKSTKFEQLTQGTCVLLVKDGVLMLETMKATRITQEQIFATLRNEKVSHLGKVERLYLEAGGVFSLYKASLETTAGLSTFPVDNDMVADERARIMACTHCGLIKDGDDKTSCKNCGSNKWTAALQ